MIGPLILADLIKWDLHNCWYLATTTVWTEILFSNSSTVDSWFKRKLVLGQIHNMSHHLQMNWYVQKMWGLDSNEFQLKWRFGTHGNWKN